MTLSQTWNLKTLFANNPSCHSPSGKFQELEGKISQLAEHLENSSSLIESILLLQEVESIFVELESLIICLLAQDTSDQQAVQYEGQRKECKARIESLSQALNRKLLTLDDTTFQMLLETPGLQPLSFVLQERRLHSQGHLNKGQEDLINYLSIDGYQGWYEIYATWMGQILIPFKDQKLSVGQADSYLSYPDRETRQTVFKNREMEWKSKETLFAQILNHLAGFRLKVYEQRKWNDELKEPLEHNRMQSKTLNAMWNTIQTHKHVLQPYLKKKASLLGIEKLAWFDLEAPLYASSSFTIPYEEAASLIVQQFQQFSPRMGEFAKKAFEERWIEAEDRAGKMPGGFCTSFPESKQSRIFMTYNGTLSNLFTLAHELGHAYHNEVVQHLPYLSQQYRMNVAETASTLAELIVIDAILKKAPSKEEKMRLLDSKLQRSVIFLMNIHARFLFETRFYEKRKQGYVLSSELKALMEEAQKEAYQNTLSEWHPYFWLDKGHFYFTDVPFYNFPYTFGYLFSLGIYARALQQGQAFNSTYDILLEHTGQMSTETLAQKFLGIDLTEPSFWEEDIQLIEKDVKDFLELADS